MYIYIYIILIIITINIYIYIYIYIYTYNNNNDNTNNNNTYDNTFNNNNNNNNNTSNDNNNNQTQTATNNNDHALYKSPERRRRAKAASRRPQVEKFLWGLEGPPRDPAVHDTRAGFPMIEYVLCLHRDIQGGCFRHLEGRGGRSRGRRGNRDRARWYVCDSAQTSSTSSPLNLEVERKGRWVAKRIKVPHAGDVFGSTTTTDEISTGAPIRQLWLTKQFVAFCSSIGESSKGPRLL